MSYLPLAAPLFVKATTNIDTTNQSIAISLDFCTEFYDSNNLKTWQIFLSNY